MSKIITESFSINKAKGFFNDKKATTLAKLSNLAGEEIKKEATVTITSRGFSRISFDVKDDITGIVIRNVWCEQLKLIEDDNTN